MSRILYRHVVTILVFLTLAAFSWTWGGARASALYSTIPWLWAIMFEAMLCFPQRREHEDIVQARQRAWLGMAHDPIFYFSLVLLFVLIFPFFNRALCPTCDYPLILAGHSPNPPVPYAPFCLNFREHYGVVQWFVPVLTAVLACRHAFAKDGKRAFYEMIVWNGALLAVFGFIQQATEAAAPYWFTPSPAEKGIHFFSTFGYPNMGAAFFTFCFALSIGLWRERVRQMLAELPTISSDERHNSGPKQERLVRRLFFAHYSLIPVALNFFAALATLSRAAVVACSALAVLAFVLTLLEQLNARKNRVWNVKAAAVTVVAGLVALIVINVFAPDELKRETDTINSMSVLNRVSGKYDYHMRTSWALFKKHKFFGVGGWGYAHLCTTVMKGEDLKHLQKVGGANVHNDYRQFFCEHGLVGAGSLFAIITCLFVGIASKWRKIVRSGKFMKGREAPPRPVSLFAPPPPMLWTVLGSLCVIVHAMADCPLRSPAVLMIFLTALACADGFIPHDIEGHEHEHDHRSHSK